MSLCFPQVLDLELLLTLDQWLTNRLAICANPKTKYLKLLQRLCLTLEVSGHGVPWFLIAGFLLTGSFVIQKQFMWVYGFNLLAILILDIILVAPLKLIFKRPRPPLNNGQIIFTVSSVDSYAFPSGHASRAVALAAFFCYMPPFHVWTHLWYIWAGIVSVSRIMLGRHHISDVFAGAVAGLLVFEGIHQTCLLTIS